MYISRSSFIEKLEKTLVNPQDKFLMYGLFSGVIQTGLKGFGIESICSLKVSDVDLEKRIIRFADKKIKMDEHLTKYAKDTIEESNLYFKNENSIGIDATELNMKSEYVLKSRPCSITNNGLNPLKATSLKKRYKTLIDALELSEPTTAYLKRSGAVSLILEKNKKSASANEIYSFLKEHDYVFGRAIALEIAKYIKTI